MATKKRSKPKKTLPRGRVKASAVTQRATYAELRQQLAEALQREQEKDRKLAEALEQQTATSEILKVISRSTFDLQPVLQTLVENATSLCGAETGFLARPDGDVLRMAVGCGTMAKLMSFYEANPAVISRGSLLGRTFIERRAVHIEDVLADPEYKRTESQKRGRYRTMLGVPLLRHGEPLGVIGMFREEVRPFTAKQIELVTTFADQAVIAIENVRLFKELQERNAELREALEHQTATSEVLGIISRSAFDLQPVLEAVAQNAATLCSAEQSFIFRFESGVLNVAVAHNASPELREFVQQNPIVPGRSSTTARAALERQTIHIPDILADPDYTYEAWRVQPHRSVLAVPMLKGEDLLGVITVNRSEMRPFTDKQIELVTTFADQAVIAIENTRLLQELQTRNRDLTEALEQQTATSEILRVIASSPTDLQPVLDTVAESAARLCDGSSAFIQRVDGNVMRRVAAYPYPAHLLGEETVIDRRRISGRAITDRQTIHVHDVSVEVQSEFPGGRNIQPVTGTRSALATPLLREGVAIGVIFVRRTEVRPFSEKQIALLKTFADQAVIAIENVRLFKELQERNAELREALEQQTATSEVLRVIASSPTDLQPVLDTVAESAATLCNSDDAQIYRVETDLMRKVASYGSIPTERMVGEAQPVTRGSATGRAILGAETVHIHNMMAEREEDWPDVWHIHQRLKIPTTLAVPLLRQGIPIGAIMIRRTEVRPFSEKQIALLKTFADQAVIAIENVRLFNELKEALDQQTATSEILGVIANSPTNIQPVLDAIAQSAARVCGSDDASIRLLEGEEMVWAAHFGTIPMTGPGRRTLGVRSVGNEALLQRRTIHIPDLQAEAERYPDSTHLGSDIRTFLVTPLLREGTAIGVIAIRRKEVKPFTDKQVALLETFASQAVIAIENVRLFKELQERNRDLTEALEQQTATSEVLKAISRSTFDLQPVLETLIENATRLCGANQGYIYKLNVDLFRLAVAYNVPPELRDFFERNPIRLADRGSILGRVALDHRPVHIPDVLADPEFAFKEVGARIESPVRTLLGVPMLREGTLLGGS